MLTKEHCEREGDKDGLILISILCTAFLVNCVIICCTTLDHMRSKQSFVSKVSGFLPSPQLWRFSNFPRKQKHSRKQMSICIETSSLSSERVRKRTKMLTALIVIDGRRLEVNFYLCESRDKRNLAKNSSMCRRKMIYQKHMKVINYYQAPLSCLLTSTITADILSALLDKTTKLLFYCPCGRQMTRNGMEKPERIFC